MLTEIEAMRKALHEVAAAAESLTDPKVLETADRLDKLIVQKLRDQELNKGQHDSE